MKKILAKVENSNLFVFLIALVFIAFGFYYWSTFSSKVDETANKFRLKSVKSTITIDTDIAFDDFANFISNYYNQNIYQFDKFVDYYISGDFQEGDSLAYFFFVPIDSKQTITFQVKYTKIPASIDLKKHSENCLKALKKYIYE